MAILLFTGIQLAIGINYSDISTNHLSQKFNVTIDGKVVQFDEDMGYPSLINQRTMVPIRVISENMGYKVTWDSVGRIVEIKDKETEVSFKENESTALVNGVRKPMDRRDGKVVDTKSYIESGRTMVPLRFITEAFGANIEYARRPDGVHFIVIDTTGKEIKPIEFPNFKPEPKPEPKPGNPVKGSGARPGMKGNGSYTIYPEQNKVVYNGPIKSGAVQSNLIGNEPKGWVEPLFMVTPNLNGRDRRGNTMFNISILNSSDYTDIPKTSTQASSKYEKLAEYNVIQHDGSVTRYSGERFKSRSGTGSFYSLTLTPIGKYDDGTSVKRLPFGTIVPVTIEYTHKGHTKTYEMPIEISND